MHYLLSTCTNTTHTHTQNCIYTLFICSLTQCRNRGRGENQTWYINWPLVTLLFHPLTCVWGCTCIHTHHPHCHHWGALKLPAQLQALFNTGARTKMHKHTHALWVLVIVTEAIIIILWLERWILLLSAGPIQYSSSTHTRPYTLRYDIVDMRGGRNNRSDIPAVLYGR